MSQLTLEQPGNHNHVRSVGENGIRIGDQRYRGNLLLSANDLQEDWGPLQLEDIEDVHFEPILALQPEVVLLGTGARQQFLHPSRLAPCHRAGVGIELMTTEAACRTFNVLVAEGRRVVAALLPLALPQT
jgi:uncharacterized protein